MADALPDATLVRIPDVGHLSAVEDPARFNRAVGDFLMRL
jgi:pimeloyl-ACP methyl ester carboxylesterase